jgi:hypothetical protein
MKNKLYPTTTPVGTFFCSEEEIKAGDTFECDGIIYTCSKEDGKYIEALDRRSRAGVTSFDRSICKKVLYQLQSDNIIEGVPVVPLEDDIEGVALKYFDDDTNSDRMSKVLGFIHGYNFRKQSQQDKRLDIVKELIDIKDRINEFEFSVNQNSYIQSRVQDLINKLQPQIDFVEVDDIPVLYQQKLNGIDTICVRAKINWKS